MKNKNGIYTEIVKVIDGEEKRLTIHPKIVFAVSVADTLSKEISGKEIVITSIFDGNHGKHSLHYVGRAFDMRIWIYSHDELSVLIDKLREALGEDYDVVLESDHIHIEYDPK